MKALIIIIILSIAGAIEAQEFSKSKLIVLKDGKEAECKAEIALGSDTLTVDATCQYPAGGGTARERIRKVIAYNKIKKLTYEQSHHSRIAAVLLISPWAMLSKRKHHWFTIQFIDAMKKGQLVLLRLDKRDQKSFRHWIEAKTGIEVVRVIDD